MSSSNSARTECKEIRKSQIDKSKYNFVTHNKVSIDFQQISVDL